MRKIGIIGSGQAGQRIAVALNQFEDVTITGIVDPVNEKKVLANPDSHYYIEDSTFYSSDDEMLSNEYDGIIVAADPINVVHPLIEYSKVNVMVRNSVECPILWERPLGFESAHPEEIERIVPSRHQTVISFTRYGLPAKVINNYISTHSFGEVVDFEIYVTLNCGLQSKTWRHLGDMGVTQPVHLLDNAFEQIELMNIGDIGGITSRRKDVTRNGLSFDEKWEINVEMSSGVTGRIIGLQYSGNTEFLYGLRSYKIVGTKGAISASHGITRYIDTLGNEHKITRSSFGIDPRIVRSVSMLEKFFRDIDGYPSGTPSQGESYALSECLRAWVDTFDKDESLKLSNLATPQDSARHLALASAAIESAAKNKCIKTSHLYPE